MEVEAPLQEDPFELLEIALKVTGNQMESKRVILLYFTRLLIERCLL